MISFKEFWMAPNSDLRSIYTSVLYYESISK